ncbi:MAG TPA: permease [Armatimonadota bacterium]|nr:permease [Armatimonadota bacterium]
MPAAAEHQQSTTPAPRRARAWPTVRTVILLLLGLAGWLYLYLHLARFADWYTYDVLGYQRAVEKAQSIKIIEGCACLNAAIPDAQAMAAQRGGQAAAFLLYQLPHTFMLLFLVVFLMGIVRSWFSAERTRRLLAGRHPLTARILAAGLGVVTPFCSCSAAPLFIGFVAAGVPLGATFTFLVAAPLVDKIALVLLFDTFKGTPLQWPIVLLYLGTGLAIALCTGWLVDRLRLQRYVEAWVLAMSDGAEAEVRERLSFNDRVRLGFVAVQEIFGRVWLFVLIGVAVGAVLHAVVPQAWLLGAFGAERWWSVPLAVLVGVPMYANPAGLIPVVQALFAKGVPVGTLLALMMAVVGLSLPECIILRKVLQTRLILIFVGSVATGILIVGYVFNLVLSR